MMSANIGPATVSTSTPIPAIAIVFLDIICNSSYTINIEIIIGGFGVIAVLTYISFIFMIRPVQLSSDVNCRLLYNIITGDFLGHSIYLSYYLAQEAIEQTGRKWKKICQTKIWFQHILTVDISLCVRLTDCCFGSIVCRHISLPSTDTKQHTTSELFVIVLVISEMHDNAFLLLK